MSQKINVLIIDDEAPARELLIQYLDKLPDFTIAGTCENGFEALKAVRELKPDLLLLDIQMPKINGFELLEVLNPFPEIIFTTAYEQYAIKAFEMNAVDYLLKPFSFTRFEQALEKARLRLTTPASAKKKIVKLKEQLDQDITALDRIITRTGSKIHIIPVDEVHYLEAREDYVLIHSNQGNHLKEQTMKYYEAHLPEAQFVRIHRSYIVNISEILSVELYAKDTHLVTLKCGDKIKTSREGYKRLRALL